jgi:hypothetical protein
MHLYVTLTLSIVQHYTRKSYNSLNRPSICSVAA